MTSRAEVEAEIAEIEKAEIEKVLDALHLHPGCTPFYLYMLTGTSMTTLRAGV